MYSDLSAAIIAGGKSRRFGQDKLQAMYNGKCLIEHATALAQMISTDIMFMVGAHSTAPPDRFNCFIDLEKQCGPLAGIYTALYYTKNPWVAFLPADMPCLPDIVYKYLYNLKSINAPCFASFKKKKQPLISIWPKSLLEKVYKSIKNNELGVLYLLNQLKAKEIDFAEQLTDARKEWFININYKKDLLKLAKQK